MTGKSLTGMTLAGLLMLALLIGPAAADQHYYVDDNGSNSNGGTGPFDAWKTITWALNHTDGTAMSDPVIIHAAPGTYDTTMGGGDHEEFPLQLKNYDAIEGAGATGTHINGDEKHSVFKFEGVRRESKLEGVSISNGGGWDAGGIYCNDSAPEISDCDITDNHSSGTQSGDVPYGVGAGIYLTNSAAYIHGCNITYNTGNAYGFGGGGIYCGENSSDTRIDACIITYNSARRGAGILCYKSSPTISGCTIDHNTCFKFGGGVWLYVQCSPRIENCTIDDNTAEECYGGLGCTDGSSPYIINTTINRNKLSPSGQYWAGGGVRLATGSSPVFIRCEICDNGDDGVTKDGSGVYMSGECKPRFYGCTISRNKATRWGGGMYCIGAKDVIVQDCTFDHNDAMHGGGIELRGEAEASIIGCTISNNTASGAGGGIFCNVDITNSTKIEHCIISGNTSDEYGGGIACNTRSEPRIFNNLIVGNMRGATADGAGIACVRESSPEVLNCTIAGSTGEGVYAMYDNGDLTSFPTLTNCIIWDNSGPDIVNVDCSQISHSDIQDEDCDENDGNFSDDPDFVNDPDHGSDDYLTHYLSKNGVDGQTEDSPCRDAGDRDADDEDLMLHTYTTRTDDEYDDGTVDMGYHHESAKNYYYVNAVTGDNGNDGRSADNAWKTINYGLTHVPSGDENNPITIRVAEGTYNADLGEEFPLWPRSDSISLIGAGLDRTIIDAEEYDGEDRKIQTVFYIEKQGMEVRDHIAIEGFKITGGYNHPTDSGCGGGIRCTDANNITIKTCDIDGNEAKLGGGIYFREVTDSNIISTSIRNNKAVWVSEPSGDGGGLYFRGGVSSVVVEFCRIAGNTADGRGGALAMEGDSINECKATVNGSTIMDNTANNGGGICARINSSPTIFITRFINNTASNDGGGVFFEEADAGAENKCHPTLAYSLLSGNRASRYGGGLYAKSCTPELLNWDDVIANEAGSDGGGIYCSGCTWDYDPGNDKYELLLFCSVVAKNTAGSGGGGVHLAADSHPWIISSTVEGNSPSGIGAAEFSEPTIIYSIIWNNGDDFFGSIDCAKVSYCDIQDEHECDGSAGVMHADPLFVPRDPDDETAYTGYYLAHIGVQNRQSPCIDAGDVNSDWMGMHVFTTCTDGRVDTDKIDYGYHYMYGYEGSDDTYIELASFEAKASGRSILITWETGAEIDNAGFDLYRVEAGDRTTPRRINERMIPAKGSPAAGASYEFIDADVRPGVTYSYYLLDVGTDGTATTHGPVSARVPERPVVIPDERIDIRVKDRPATLRVMSFMPRFWPVL